MLLILQQQRQPTDDEIKRAFDNAVIPRKMADGSVAPRFRDASLRISLNKRYAEQRRKEMVKLVHKMAEEGRIAVRNVRRDVLNDMKKAEKEGELSRDELNRAQDEVQKLTDAEVKAIDELMGRKEAEILEV